LFANAVVVTGLNPGATKQVVAPLCAVGFVFVCYDDYS